MGNTLPKVMIVDDNPVCLKQSEAIAKKLCDCVCVDSGDKAVTAIVDTFRNKDKQFDACFLDFEMPGMNGLEVISEIRKSEKKRDVPENEKVKIIMVTSHSDRDVVNACKTMGCNHYILKPLTHKNIQEKLNLFKLI